MVQMCLVCSQHVNLDYPVHLHNIIQKYFTKPGSIQMTIATSTSTHCCYSTQSPVSIQFENISACPGADKINPSTATDPDQVLS